MPNKSKRSVRELLSEESTPVDPAPAKLGFSGCILTPQLIASMIGREGAIGLNCGEVIVLLLITALAYYIGVVFPRRKQKQDETGCPCCSGYCEHNLNDEENDTAPIRRDPGDGG